MRSAVRHFDGVPHFDLSAEEWIVPVYRQGRDESEEPSFYAHVNPHLDFKEAEKALVAARVVTRVKSGEEIPDIGDPAEIRALTQKMTTAITGILAQRNGDSIRIEPGDANETALLLAKEWWQPPGRPGGIPPLQLDAIWRWAWERIERDEAAAGDEDVMVAHMGSSEDITVGRDYYRFAFDPLAGSTVRIRIRPRIKIGSEADHRRLQQSIRQITKGKQRFLRVNYDKQRLVMKKLLTEVSGYCIGEELCRESNKDSWFGKLLFRDLSSFAVDHLLEADRGN